MAEFPPVANGAGGRRAVVVCEQWLGSNAFAGMKAMRRAGWAVEAVSEREYVPLAWRAAAMRAIGRVLRPWCVEEFNRSLLRIADRSPFDVFLAFKGSFVKAETLRTLRRRGIHCYNFFPDVSFRAHGRYLPLALTEYDWVFTTKSFGLDDLRQQLGVARASLLYHAYDPDLHRPVEISADDASRYGCDVSFIGTWSPTKEKLLEALAASRPGIHLRVWGEQWNRSRSPVLRAAIAGHALVGEEYPRAIRASRINLGLLSECRTGASNGDQVTSRTFHIPACAAFMLHQRTPELLGLFAEGRHLACFDGPEELIAQVDRFLADPESRARMAAAGRVAVERRHSWDARIREIIDHHERAKV